MHRERSEIHQLDENDGKEQHTACFAAERIQTAEDIHAGLEWEQVAKLGAEPEIEIGRSNDFEVHRC